MRTAADVICQWLNQAYCYISSEKTDRHGDSGYVPTLVRSLFLLVDLMSGHVKVLYSVHHNVKHDLHHSVTVKQDYLSQLENSRT